MCGIVGYIGKGQAFPILIKGLKRLEYRGYDSAGVALLPGAGELNIYKTKGKVSNLEELCKDKNVQGHIGIAHTRWATHGEPSSLNAHPHVSQDGNLAIIHNGIIENFSYLAEQLSGKGYSFKSTTDTEVLVQLIDFYYKKTPEDLLEAVRRALRKVVGAYAIAVIDRNHPEHIVAARQSSPLVVGMGKDEAEYFIASDATPIVEYTKQVVYLDDGQIADIRPGQPLHIVNLEAQDVEVDIKEVDMDISKLSKGGFPHFMLKEIYDQPQCLQDCLSGRLTIDNTRPELNKIVLSAVEDYKERLISAKHIIIVACGTSWHAGLIGKQLIEKTCRIR
ncbi:MAG: isomerizing glutamine--fructose-6-phosphate transaminase, partial [Alloprevotella tannerae]|nr:isomerizing glutamine--fructose-6-phosphate transaminase [Alloprevotella tannerae]